MLKILTRALILMVMAQTLIKLSHAFAQQQPPNSSTFEANDSSENDTAILTDSRNYTLYATSGDGNVYAINMRNQSVNILLSNLTNPKSIIIDYVKQRIFVAQNDNETAGFVYAFPYSTLADYDLSISNVSIEYLEGSVIRDIYPAQESIKLDSFFYCSEDGIFVLNDFPGDKRQIFLLYDGRNNSLVGDVYGMFYETSEGYQPNYLYWLSLIGTNRIGLRRSIVYWYDSSISEDQSKWMYFNPENITEFDGVPYAIDKVGDDIYVSTQDKVFCYNLVTQELKQILVNLITPRGIKHLHGMLYIGDNATSSIYEYNLGNKELKRIIFDIKDPQNFFIDESCMTKASLILISILLILII